MVIFDLIRNIPPADLVRYPFLVSISGDADEAVESENQFITQRKWISFIRGMILHQFNSVFPLNLPDPDPGAEYVGTHTATLVELKKCAAILFS